ncbi:hypothetical protein KVR01_008130 [Diaporthe batatas]|uniref:uncharacterized protein n=1 Tax=Diaporthe batatas TaxID=748121 RepID=UPI001D05A69F|nr:uncharacterized protein KVR01_008130 [Diaporthe batatas]KAG8162365.1 hypothetical protein KVR01_008130 [Diaporthe batatas]
MFVHESLGHDALGAASTTDHSSRASSVMAVNILFICVVAIVVSLRAFTKHSMTRKLYLEDYLMIASSLWFFSFCAVNLAAVPVGFGQHVWDLPGATRDDQFAVATRVQKLNYLALILLSPAIVLAKVSIIAILLRIFPQPMKCLRLFLFATAGLIILCCTCQAFLVIFQCSPVQFSWMLGGPNEGTCYGLEPIVLTLGIVNVVTDFVICFTPIPSFLRLKMPAAQKACLCALFLTGLIACAFSIVRVLSLRGLANNIDVTFASVTYYNWSVVETGFIIITGSVPSLRPLLATILPEFFKSTNFPSLFSSQRRSTWKAVNSSSSTRGMITVTKDFEVTELRKEISAA